MTEKKSTKSTLLGLSTSTASLIGVSCGSGACAAACGAVCAAPIASVLGISTAGFSTFTNDFLPVFTAISAIAFTMAYYSIYKKKNNDECCPKEDTRMQKPKNRWTKPIFWIGLLLTLGFYVNAMANNFSSKKECEVKASSCSVVNTSPSCNPSNCATKNKKEE